MSACDQERGCAPLSNAFPPPRDPLDATGLDKWLHAFAGGDLRGEWPGRKRKGTRTAPFSIAGDNSPDMYRRVPPTLASRPARYGLVGVVAAGILLASVVDPGGAGPSSGGPLGLVGLDKWVHALAYGGLAGALAYALVPPVGVEDGPRVGRPAGLAVVVSLAAAFGLGVELLQWTLPYRSFDPADAVANTVGALAVAAGWGLTVARGRVRRVG